MLRGAGVPSDYHLVLTAARLRLKEYTKRHQSQLTRYNPDLLKNKDTQTACQISLFKRFQLLHGMIDGSETDLETEWEESKRVWQDTCEKVLEKKAQLKE